MSAMWNVEVMRADGRSADFLVIQVQEQSGDFCSTLPFAFRLLMESVSLTGAKGPLMDALPEGAYLDESYVRSRASEFIERAELVDEGEAFDHDVLVDELTANGLAPGSEAFETKVAEAKLNFQNCPPKSVLRVTLVDRRWAAHLRVGLRWDSAAYP